MTITAGAIAAMETEMKAAMGDLLTPQRVLMFGGGEVQVKLHVGQRRAASPEMTGGMETQNQYATIDADDWDAKVGRIPQRGDQIEWVGRKFAIEDNQTLAPGGNKIFYKCRLNG